jgi:UDP-galactopyranose mutase
MLCVDYLVIGAGLTGATIARLLADMGREVAVLERRTHVGGNVHDTLHTSGIRIHTYGPHYFRTGSQRIWEFVNRFASFYDYKAQLLSWVDERYEHWPAVKSCLIRLAGANWSPGFKGVPTNFEEASLSMMPQIIYEKFVKGYTEKQWGVPAHTLAVDLARRFDIRSDDDVWLSRHKYQGLPLEGYHSWMKKMLDGIPVFLGTDYLKGKEGFRHKKRLIFTGPIDELFSFRFGRLKYRGQRRDSSFFRDRDRVLPSAQVNNPDHAYGAHVRTIEWKHLMAPDLAKKIVGTVITTETPYTALDPNDYEYPFPDAVNRRLYQDYVQAADHIPNLIVCGRLGEYRYYDMDQVIGRAMIIARRLLSSKSD